MPIRIMPWSTLLSLVLLSSSCLYPVTTVLVLLLYRQIREARGNPALPPTLRIPRKMFQYFDSDGDGKWKVADLRAAVGALEDPELDKVVTNSKLRDLFTEYDTDEDGRLSYSEFLSLMLGGTGQGPPEKKTRRRGQPRPSAGAAGSPAAGGATGALRDKRGAGTPQLRAQAAAQAAYNKPLRPGAAGAAPANKIVLKRKEITQSATAMALLDAHTGFAEGGVGDTSGSTAPQDASTAAAQGPTLAGFLFDRMKTRRWFELGHLALAYWAAPRDVAEQARPLTEANAPLGLIDLRQVHDVAVYKGKGLRKGRHGLELVLDGDKHYQLAAETEKDCRQWIEALRAHARLAKPHAAHTHAPQERQRVIVTVVEVRGTPIARGACFLTVTVGGETKRTAATRCNDGDAEWGSKSKPLVFGAAPDSKGLVGARHIEVKVMKKGLVGAGCVGAVDIKMAMLAGESPRGEALSLSYPIKVPPGKDAARKAGARRGTLQVLVRGGHC